MYTHGTTSPFPSTSERLLSPLTMQVISLPLLCKKYQQTLEISRGTWPTVLPFLRTATAKSSWMLLTSRWTGSSSPMYVGGVLAGHYGTCVPLAGKFPYFYLNYQTITYDGPPWRQGDITQWCFKYIDVYIGLGLYTSTLSLYLVEVSTKINPSLVGQCD